MDQLDPFPEDFCLLPYYAGRNPGYRTKRVDG